MTLHDLYHSSLFVRTWVDATLRGGSGRLFAAVCHYRDVSSCSRDAAGGFDVARIDDDRARTAVSRLTLFRIWMVHTAIAREGASWLGDLL